MLRQGLAAGPVLELAQDPMGLIEKDERHKKKR
jgi:hypothetical protein